MFVSHLKAVIRQRLLKSGDVELNPGPLQGEDNRLTAKHFPALLQQLKVHAHRWREIGTHLGFHPGSLSNIESRLSLMYGAPVSHLGAMLEEWIQWAPGDSRGSKNFATLRLLKKALSKAGLGAAAHDFSIATDEEIPSDSEAKATGHSDVTSVGASKSASLPGGEMEIREEYIEETYVFPATSAPSGAKPQLSFPCLNIKDMSKEEKQQLHQRLYAESMDMIDKFQNLLSATTESLKKQGTSVKSLLCHLVGLGPHPPAYRGLNLPEFSRQLPELTKSRTIDEAMVVIGNYCSFFNYRMIEHIINKLGTRKDHKNLSKYREHFSQYAERLVFECPSQVGETSEGLANMYVTLDKVYDSYTLNSLELFVNNLRKILNISYGAVFKVCHIARGSLKLTFQLPYSVLGDIFPLNEDQRAALSDLGVRRIWTVEFDDESSGMEYVEETVEGVLVSMVTNLKVGCKDEDTLSIASDSGFGTSSVITAATEDTLDRDEPYLRMEHDAAKLRPAHNTSELELHRASERGELDEVKRLIEEKKMNPLQKDRRENNALHYAADGGHLPVVQYLIEDQALVPACPGWRGFTPLHCAAYGNHLQVVQYLIDDQQVDPLCQNEDNYTPLHRACQGGDVSVVRYLVNEMSNHLLLKDAIYDRTKEGSTPAHLAALHGHLQVVKLFISEFNFDPNTPGFRGKHPLHDAAQNGHLNIVKYLVEEVKCDPSCCPGEDKETPLHMASQRGHLAVVKYLTLDKQCNPLPRNSYGNTPLHNAALHGRFEIVDFFISELNSDPNTPGQRGVTPLHSAAQGGHLNIVKYLIEEHNCNPSSLDNLKTTLLHLAAIKGHVDVIKYLTKEHHCNHLCYDKALGIPLHWAAHYGQLEAVKYFVEELKCPQNIRGHRNTTPLQEAYIKGHTSVVEYLMSH